MLKLYLENWILLYIAYRLFHAAFASIFSAMSDCRGFKHCKWKTWAKRLKWEINLASCSFKHQKDVTTLSQYIWKLREKNIAYSLKWKIVAQSRPYSNISKICNLCLTEKYFIIFRHYMASLNIRNGLASSCRHKKKFLLAN